MNRYFVKNKPYAFVSYAHRDRRRVSVFINALHERGCNLWYDENIYAGSDWTNELMRRIEKASCVLVFVSAKSANAAFVLKEAKYAASKKCRILPIILDDGVDLAALEFAIGTIQGIEIGDDGEQTVAERIREAVPEEIFLPLSAFLKKDNGSRRRFCLFRSKKIRIVFLLFLLIGLGVIAFLKIREPVIDLTDFIDVQYSGYNGCGRVYAILDCEAIGEKYGSRIAFSDEAEEEYGKLTEAYEPENLLSDLIDIYVLPAEGAAEFIKNDYQGDYDSFSKLKNGDKIAVVLRVDENIIRADLSIRAEFSKETAVRTFIVEGLRNAQANHAYDLLAGLSVCAHEDGSLDIVPDSGGEVSETVSGLIDDGLIFCEPKTANAGERVTLHLSKEARARLVCEYGQDIKSYERSCVVKKAEDGK